MFAIQSEMAVPCPAGDNNRLGFDRLAVHREHKRSLRGIDRFDTCKLDSRSEAFRLLLHAAHQFVAIDPLRKTGKILHRARGRKQAARHGAGQDEWI